MSKLADGVYNVRLVPFCCALAKARSVWGSLHFQIADPPWCVAVLLWLAVQLFFKRSTLYIPFILVGAYFANEVRKQEIGTLHRTAVVW